MRDERSLLQALLGDGRFLIALTGISLVLSGGFAIFQSISGELLPHDSHALGMNATALLPETREHATRGEELIRRLLRECPEYPLPRVPQSRSRQVWE